MRSRDLSPGKNWKTPSALPTLPHILLELIEASQKPDVEMKDLSKIISADAALSAKVLQLANSPFIGLVKKAASIESAVVYLGIKNISNLAISASVLEVFRGARKSAASATNKLWWHSFLCGSIARRLSGAADYDNGDEAYLAGIMHDIGKLVILERYPERYSEMIGKWSSKDDGLELERASFGADHCRLGAWLVSRWNFNSMVGDSILYHHEPLVRMMGALPLTKIIYAANLLCHNVSTLEEETVESVQSLLGVTAEMQAGIIDKSWRETEKTAKLFGLEIEARPQSEGSAEATVGQPKEQKEDIESTFIRKQTNLMNMVKTNSLVFGTLQNMLEADSPKKVVNTLLHGLHLLFDINKFVVFIYNEEGKYLAGMPQDKSIHYRTVQSFKISIHNNQILPVRSFIENRIKTTLEERSSGGLSIADEQLLGLLEEENGLCVPIGDGRINLGVIFMAGSNERIQNVESKPRVLNLLAKNAGMRLGAFHLKRMEAKRMEAERKNATDLLSRILIHEVNNPLGIIKNYLSVLQRKLPEDMEANEDIRVIREEVNRVGVIITKMSPGAESGRLNEEGFELNALVKDTLRIMDRAIFQPAGIELKLSLDPMTATIIADKNHIIQVLMNLVKNAGEALSEGGRIEVETRRIDPAETGDGRKTSRIQIIVRDNGPGIPDVIRRNLFNAVKSTKGEGHFGIGLSIVKNLVSELDGEITCESEEGEGTAFIIRIPSRI